MNPLTKKTITSTRYVPTIGDRIAINPGRSGINRLYIGNVVCIWTHKKYGTIVDIRCDDGSGLKGIAVEHLTVKVISKATAE